MGLPGRARRTHGVGGGDRAVTRRERCAQEGTHRAQSAAAWGREARSVGGETGRAAAPAIAERRRSGQDDGLHGEGVAPPGRDGRDPAEGSVQELTARCGGGGEYQAFCHQQQSARNHRHGDPGLGNEGTRLRRDHGRGEALHSRGPRRHRCAAAVHPPHVGVARHPGECRP